jgi:hypothetical protein
MERETGRSGKSDETRPISRLNESNSINLSLLMMNDGSGPVAALDRGAGTRAARISGEANRDKGGDHTCAFS